MLSGRFKPEMVGLKRAGKVAVFTPIGAVMLFIHRRYARSFANIAGGEVFPVELATPEAIRDYLREAKALGAHRVFSNPTTLEPTGVSHIPIDVALSRLPISGDEAALLALLA